jgi:hypothetical protein
MVLKLGQFRKIINTMKVMKCVAGEGWSSVGPIGWEMKLQKGKMEKNKLQPMKRGNANWIGHIWLRNCLLKHAFDGNTDGRMKSREDKEEDLSSYWISFRKREGTVNWKRKHYFILGGRYYGPVGKKDNRMCSDSFIPGVSVSSSWDRNRMLWKTLVFKDLLKRKNVQHVRGQGTKLFP